MRSSSNSRRSGDQDGPGDAGARTLSAVPLHVCYGLTQLPAPGLWVHQLNFSGDRKWLAQLGWSVCPRPNHRWPGEVLCRRNTKLWLWQSIWVVLSDNGLANHLTEACISCFLVWTLEEPSACLTDPFSTWHFLINWYTWAHSLFLDTRVCPEDWVILFAFSWLLCCPQLLLSLMVLSVQGPGLHSCTVSASAELGC